MVYWVGNEVYALISSLQDSVAAANHGMHGSSVDVYLPLIALEGAQGD